ncbi:MAG: N-succinylarginine dihydrolase [Sphingobium sp.]
MLTEINFDGIVGPTHNFAGLSLGNLAATHHAGQVSHPRTAALEGIAKMRKALSLGLPQGVLLPHDRPDRQWLAALATTVEEAEPGLRVNALSASSMWSANAATVSPAPDTGDGRCHLTVANLLTMPHRSHEWPETLRQLSIAFGDGDHFAIHGPVLPPFGDEGAANHMRLATAHDAPGVEIFVYGISGGSFPARQHVEASRVVARRHGLDPRRTLFVAQSPEAIDAGAFHNDVVAVADMNVLFAHEQAFADKERFYTDLLAIMPEAEIVEVPANRISLADAVASYLFNAQLVMPTDGERTLLLPIEAHENATVCGWLQEMVASNGPIRRLELVDVRQSMANGGGPACLRLRVVADPQTVDPRFLVDAAKLDLITAIIVAHWPEEIEYATLSSPMLWRDAQNARAKLFEALGIPLC